MTNFLFFCLFLLVKVTGEGWSSTSLIRNVSARLRSSNHMLPTDLPQSRAHPRVTYRRIFPLLLLLSAAMSRDIRKGRAVGFPSAAQSRYLDIQTKISQIATKCDGIRYREKKIAKIVQSIFFGFQPRYSSLTESFKIYYNKVRYKKLFSTAVIYLCLKKNSPWKKKHF